MFRQVANSELIRHNSARDLGAYMAEQANRLNRPIRAVVQGVEIIAMPNDTADCVRASIAQKFVGRGYDPKFMV